MHLKPKSQYSQQIKLGGRLRKINSNQMILAISSRENIRIQSNLNTLSFQEQQKVQLKVPKQWHLLLKRLKLVYIKHILIIQWILSILVNSSSKQQYQIYVKLLSISKSLLTPFRFFHSSLNQAFLSLCPENIYIT